MSILTQDVTQVKSEFAGYDNGIYRNEFGDWLGVIDGRAVTSAYYSQADARQAWAEAIREDERAKRNDFIPFDGRPMAGPSWQGAEADDYGLQAAF